jgi:hypothetical protein
MHRMFTGWLMSGELSGSDKAAVVAAWEAMDTNGYRSVLADDSVPLEMRLLLRDGR